MPHFDDPSPLRLAIHRAPTVGRGAGSRPCRVSSSHERPRLRLVHSRRAPRLPFGIHPALPSTLAFAAVSVTALAYAALIDVANGAATIAASVGERLRGALA